VPVDMKHFPAVDEPAATYDSRRVEDCDVYVGIYGLRWGTPVLAQPTISCTEQEFDHATASGLTRLIFTIDTSSTELGLPPDALLDPEHGQRQQAFLQRVRNSGLIVKPFSNPEDLKALVERSLRELADSKAGGSGGEAVPFPASLYVPWPHRGFTSARSAFLHKNDITK